MEWIRDIVHFFLKIYPMNLFYKSYRQYLCTDKSHSLKGVQVQLKKRYENN